IFITHPHLAHYDPISIDLVAQNATTFIGPSSCSEFISEYDAIGVVPGDKGTVAVSNMKHLEPTTSDTLTKKTIVAISLL
ncbi:MAG: hypothetical protein ACFFB3_01935, partial [Candidatus Hodarchaeota archaeon]